MRWPWQKRSVTESAVDPAADVTKAATYGYGGFVPSVPVPPPTQPAGADGVAIYGGFIVSGERDPKLDGRQKWVTYSNTELNIAICASALNVWTQLAGSAKWTVEPNKRGGAKAQLGADIVTEGLLEAQTSSPWQSVVRRQSVKKFRGFALHEVTVRRRSDDMIVVADIQDRPQWTIWRWNRPDPKESWIGVEQQLLITSEPYYIPRERLFYSVENTLSASPEGIGVWRQVAESVRVLELYRQWEGIGFQTDLRGVPIARAPLGEIRKTLPANATDAELQAGVMGKVKFLTDFLRAHNKRSDQGILLDSAPYFNKDAGQSPSGSPQWGFDLVKAGASSMPEVNTAIMREVHDIARVMCAEWLLLGGEDSGSSRAMHEDKTAMFGLLVNSVNEDIANDATRDIATRLIALNGLDPETCTPRLVPEPVASGAVKDACAALQAMAAAALAPNDKAINVLRARLNLPPAPEVLPDMYGAMPVVDANGDGVPDDQEAAPGAGDPGNPNAALDSGGAPTGAA